MKRRCLAILFVVVFGALAGAETGSAKKVRAGTDVSFPGGQVWCSTTGARVGCFSSQFDSVECGGPKMWILKRRGRVKNGSSCGGGNYTDSLAEGKSFSYRGVRCTALSDGVRCSNKSKHGFKITSASRSKF